MRLTIIALTGLDPWIVSGPGIFLSGLMSYLAHHGFEGDIFIGPQPQNNERCLAKHFQVHYWITYPTCLRRAFSYARFWMECIRSTLKNDAVLFNLPPIGISSLILGVAFLTQRPSMWIIHGGLFTESNQSRRLPDWYVGFISRHISQLVTVSEAMAGIITRHIHQPIAVIHNALASTKIIDPAIHSRTHHPTFIYIGRFAPIKRVDLLLQAFAQVVTRTPGCRVCLLGDGPEQTRLRAVVKELGLESHVDFLGFLTGSAKHKIMDTADVLVLSSDFESFSLAILEAWDRGLAVIGSRVGGIAEIVREGETGILFQPGSISELSTCMLRLCDPDLRERLAKAGQKELKTRFTWNRAGKAYESLIRSMVFQGRSR